MHKESWETIATKVKNLQGEEPSWKHCANVYAKFNTKKGKVPYKYDRCGRKPWKLTKQNTAFIKSRLLALRNKTVCTSTTLQREVARAPPQGLGLQVSKSSIKQVLHDAGYRWMPRAKKLKYSKEARDARLKFAKSVLNLSAADLSAKLSMSIDGVVLGLPPTDPAERASYCKNGDSHVWRKPAEALNADLLGGNSYSHQLPAERALPLWAGIAAGGVAPLTFHASKKLNSEEWVKDVVESGVLRQALREVNPKQKKGPWHILCDNETFLGTKQSREALAEQDIHLWHVPPRSPDLNPIEKYWYHNIITLSYCGLIVF